MGTDLHAPRAPGTQNESSSAGGPGAPAPDTLQHEKDREEKRKHPASENALESAQDKNPVPPGSTRE